MAELFETLPFENLYWSQMETLPVEELRELQTRRLRRTVERAKELAIYRDFFVKNTLSDSDFQSPEDVRKLPFTTLQEILPQYPNGLWTVPRHEIARVQTRRDLTMTAYTRADLQTQADLVARFMYGTGTRSNNFVQISMPYNRAGEGLAYQLGVECIGAAVVPHGDRNEEILSNPIQYVIDLNMTGICTDYYYLLDLYTVANEQRLPLKYAHIPVSFEVLENRDSFQKNFPIKIWLNWSHPAFFGAGMAGECYLQNGLHLQEDAFLFECINPETCEPVEDGKPGELVVTDLVREAESLLRFRTGMQVVLDSTPCLCGRTGRRAKFFPKDPHDLEELLKKD